MTIDRHIKSAPSKVLIAIMVLAAAAVIIGILEATDTTHFFHASKASKTFVRTPTVGGASVNSSKGEAATRTRPQSTTSDSSSSSQPGDTKNNQDSSTTASELITPSGDFVSNHHPNLSGSPSPYTMTSVCTTTPGAKCTIQFVSGDTTKSLQPQTTDRGGSAYWNWKLQDIDMTAGTWKVKAVATLNGKTVSAYDALDLVVSQ